MFLYSVELPLWSLVQNLFGLFNIRSLITPLQNNIDVESQSSKLFKKHLQESTKKSRNFFRDSLEIRVRTPDPYDYKSEYTEPVINFLMGF
jgi:hypothetical protein